MKMNKCKSGVYVIRYDDSCIKIGRSKDIESRLKQYSGYRSRGQEVHRLLLVLTPDYVQCEHLSHKFAEEYGLPRYRPYEIFECAPEKTATFLEQYQEYISEQDIQIKRIMDRFEAPSKPEAHVLAPVSNLRIKEDANVGVDIIASIANLDKFKFQPKSGRVAQKLTSN